jgi:hypothetical protein
LAHSDEVLTTLTVKVSSKCNCDQRVVLNNDRLFYYLIFNMAHIFLDSF